MKPFQILEKNDVIIAVNLSDMTSKEEVESLASQGFVVHQDIVKANSADIAKQMFSANNPKTTKPWIVIFLLISLTCIGLYMAGFNKGSSFAMQPECIILGENKAISNLAISLLPNLVDKYADGQSLPIYKQGLVAGLKKSITTCAA